MVTDKRRRAAEAAETDKAEQSSGASQVSGRTAEAEVGGSSESGSGTGLEPLNRRRALKLAGAAALGAVALGTVGSNIAEAADGSPAIIGDDNKSEAPTGFDSDATPPTNFSVLAVGTNTPGGSSAAMFESWNVGGTGPAVLGLASGVVLPNTNITLADDAVAGYNSSGNAAVYGRNFGSGDGVQGVASGTGSGVEGNNSGGGPGVSGHNTDSTTPGSGPALYGVQGVSANGVGVYGENDGPVIDGVSAIYGTSTNNDGVFGISTNNVGVQGQSTNGAGLYGSSANNAGVYGAVDNGAAGVEGDNSGSGPGVFGHNTDSTTPGSGPGPIGLKGLSAQGVGVYGESDGPTVSGVAGVVGTAAHNDGVAGLITSGSNGVGGYNFDVGAGVGGFNLKASGGGPGVVGESTSSDGVQGFAATADKSGVYGQNTNGGGVGVTGRNVAGGPGVWGSNTGSGPGVLATADSLTLTGSGVAGVYGDNGVAAFAQGGDAGVYANNLGTAGGAGVSGWSHSGDGTQGFASDDNHSGVYGQNSANGPGVSGLGQGSGAGVVGESNSGVGVLGKVGNSSAGVEGTNGDGGPGVLATNTGTGPALKTVGPVELSGSVGTATIPQWKNSVTVTNANAKTTSVVVITAQSFPGSIDFWVTTATGSFTIHAALPVAKAMTFGWILLQP